MYWQATWAEQDARTKNVETSLWFTKKIHSHWEKQGKLLSETAFFPTVKAKRSTLHFFQNKSKIIATTTDTAHGEYPPWNSHNTWNTAKASYDFISVKASWHVEKNGGDFCACRWFRLGKELQKTVFESLTPTSLAQRRSSCHLWYFSWETAIRVIRWEPSLLQKNDVSKQQERYLQCFHASCYVIYAIHIYIYKYEYTYISWKYLYIHIMCTKCISNLPLPTSPLTPAPRPNVFLQQHRIATAAPSVANLPLEPVTFFQRWARSAKTDPQTSKVNSDGINIILLMVQKSRSQPPLGCQRNPCK